ncbi:hypothetical protein Mapa_013036 [Marchantia paleacea]|nr:hypothetical protein Mapa_013036 [Marchantia paleacea]
MREPDSIADMGPSFLQMNFGHGVVQRSTGCCRQCTNRSEEIRTPDRDQRMMRPN